MIREDAWIQYKPKIEAEKTKFYAFLKKAESEDDSFTKVSLYKNAWKVSSDFMEKLEYGRIINPSEEDKYSADRTAIAELPAKIEKEQKNLTIFVNLKGDYGNIVETSIKTALEKGGFIVGSSGNYTADVIVSSNPNGENPVTIMPAVIVGVTNGDKLLLTKYKTGFAHNALIAGFTEIGETTEETVAREVMEEAGIKVKNIRYYKSQPWGSANDILLGYYCDVDGDDTITMDSEELKYAEWVAREDIVLQPGSFSLTNEMMKMFKEGKK